MRVFRTSFSQNPNIGLYVYCNNTYCLAGRIVPENQLKQIEEVLNVPVIRMSAAGTSLLGVFFAGNDSCLLVPELVFEDELKVLEKNSIKYQVVRTKLTALGNNIACNNNGAIINDEFEDVAQIKALKVPVQKSVIAGLNIPGALCAANDSAAICHKGITKNETEKAESLLKARVLAATINNSPFIKSGLVMNNHGYLISDNAKMLEISLIDQILNE